MDENSLENAVDMDRGDRRALQRREENAAQGIAQGQAEAALERLSHNRGEAFGSFARNDFELVRLDKLLPVLLNHDGAFLNAKAPVARLANHAGHK